MSPIPLRSVLRAADPTSDADLLAAFAATRDEAAFAEVVRRHGRLVRGTARRVAGHPDAADDAFQATFLLLARKASAGAWGPTVGPWLYQVACRTARKARSRLARQSAVAPAADVPARSADPAAPLAWAEVRAAIDDELARLPTALRDPLVLCYLEGLTRDEAAVALGCSASVLKGRLERGREKLRGRLARRGLTLSAALAGVLVTGPAVGAGESLTVARAAVAYLAAGVAPPAVRELMRGTAGALGWRPAAGLVGLLAACAVGAAGLAGPRPAPTADPPKSERHPSAERVDAPAEARIGASRFRAGGTIGDARYGAGGKRVVGYAGSTLYVWDASNGSLLRTIGTALTPLEDPTRYGEKVLAFAVHPKESRVACGGVKEGKTYLQVWDYETGKLVAEKASSHDALKALAWTPDGKQLLERANVGWEKPTGWKLVVRDGKLDEVRSHDLPRDFGEWSTVMLPLPGGKEVILWQGRREPTVFDLASGAVVRTLPHKPSIPSDLALSPDGKTLAATSTNEIRLLDFPGGETRTKLPVLRGGWEKPRPLFSPDGTTVYVWDHRPIAYDVATGKEKWKATFRTVHTVRVELCDVSPDGATVLARHGHALCRIDAKTGTERDPPDAPSAPSGLVWSPDGKRLFTRAERHDRTWTAWDPTTGQRLYDLLPTGFVTGEDWKLLPDLFFIRDGREIVAGLEKDESTESVGPKELLVFDAATGRCLRRLGEPLPDATFRWMHPIAVDPDGASVVMQAFAVSAPPGLPGAPVGFDPNREFEYPAVRWDPIKKAKLQEWTGRGGRITPPRHYAPFVVTVATTTPPINPPGKKPAPAKVRLYSLADGRLAHELQTDFARVDLDRIQGNFLFVEGYDSKWITRGNRSRYTPQPPFAHDLWELPSRARVRIFETDRQTPVTLGPGGRYVIRVLDDTTFEVHEPFALKKAVATVATPGRPERFEFSPDGSRVAASLADASIVVWDSIPWRKQVIEQLAREVPADLGPLWDDLAKDAATGLRAARLLSAAGDRAVSLLGEKVAPERAADGARIKQLIADLDSPTFATREKAEADLRELSTRAEAHLREALRGNPSPEVRQRVGNLLKDIEARKLTAAEVREVRAVQALEWMATDAARALLAKWAKGDPSATLTKAAERASGR